MNWFKKGIRKRDLMNRVSKLESQFREEILSKQSLVLRLMQKNCDYKLCYRVNPSDSLGLERPDSPTGDYTPPYPAFADHVKFVEAAVIADKWYENSVYTYHTLKEMGYELFGNEGVYYLFVHKNHQ